MPLLSLRDLDSNSTETVEKVYDLIEKTNSKGELAKAMAYGAAWGGRDPRGDRFNGYTIYNAACERARRAGHSAQHIDFYLPKSWGGTI